MADVPILQHVPLHSAQVIFLKEIARRAGDGMRTNLENARPDVQGMILDLMNKQLVRYVEVVTSADQLSGPTFLILTDAGTRVVSQLEDAERKKTEIQNDVAEVRVPP